MATSSTTQWPSIGEQAQPGAAATQWPQARPEETKTLKPAPAKPIWRQEKQRAFADEDVGPGEGSKEDKPPKYKHMQMQKYRDALTGKLKTYGVFDNEEKTPQERAEGGNAKGVLPLYPEYLKITEENKGVTKNTTFLDMGLDLGCGRLIFCLYDKTRAFPVYIPKYTPEGSCISDSTNYGTFASAAIRCYQKNFLAIYFLRDLSELIARFVINGTMKAKYVRKAAILIKDRHWVAKWFKAEKFIEVMTRFGKDIMKLLKELEYEGKHD
eukprot:g17088.t1